MSSELYEGIRSILSDKLGVGLEKIGLESKLVDDLGADSLDQVEVIMAIEEKYKIEIPDSDAEKISTVKQIFDYVSTRIN